MLLTLGLVVSFGFLCCCSGFVFGAGVCVVFGVCYLLFDVVVIGGLVVVWCGDWWCVVFLGFCVLEVWVNSVVLILPFCWVF